MMMEHHVTHCWLTEHLSERVCCEAHNPKYKDFFYLFMSTHIHSSIPLHRI
jgi:hypothetical protein